MCFHDNQVCAGFVNGLQERVFQFRCGVVGDDGVAGCGNAVFVRLPGGKDIQLFTKFIGRMSERTRQC